MKRSILASALVLSGMAASAQCVPSALYQDSIYGAWPDTTENFTGGIVNVFYSDTLNLLVPQDAGLVDPNYAGFVIDSVSLDGITGLPPGVSVICNSQTPASCTFITGQVGCGLLEGTPTQAGTFEMSIDVTAYSFAFGFVIPVPQTFTGYRIIVAPDNVGVNELTPMVLGEVRNTPNPFSQRTNIEFALSHAGAARVKVFNLVGEEMWKQTIDGKQGTNSVPFDASTIESGVYLYKVEAGTQTFTGRMVVNR